MPQDFPLRAAARVIYDACYPGEEWNGATPFEDAERFRTIHYRQAVQAALRARTVLVDRTKRLSLI